MAANWFILRDDKRYGPYTAADMKRHAATGHLLPIDLVLKDGMTKPAPAGKVKGLFPTAPAPSGPNGPPADEATPDPRPRPRPRPRKRLVVVAAAVTAVALVSVVGVAVALSGKRGGSARPGEPVAASAGGRGTVAEPAVDLPDFSKVDYSLDTSKLDYEKGPDGEKLVIEKRGSRDGPQAVTGFKDRTGKFVAHGLLAGKTHDGNPLLEGDVYLGKEHGKSVSFYPDGKVQKQGLMKDDEMHGKWAEFYQGGQRKSEAFHLAGKAHGPHTEWFESGQKKTELTYVQDEKHGPHTQWYASGGKSASMPYKSGKLHGTLTTWDDKGQEIVRVRFQDGKPEFKPAAETRETFGRVIEVLKAGGTVEQLEDWMRAFGRPDAGYDEAAIPKASNQPSPRQAWVYDCRDGRKEIQVRVSVGLGPLSRDQKGKAKFGGVTVVVVERVRDL